MTRIERARELDAAGAKAAKSGRQEVTGLTVDQNGDPHVIVGDPETGTGRAVDLGRR